MDPFYTLIVKTPTDQFVYAFPTLAEAEERFRVIQDFPAPSERTPGVELYLCRASFDRNLLALHREDVLRSHKNPR